MLLAFTVLLFENWYSAAFLIFYSEYNLLKWLFWWALLCISLLVMHWCQILLLTFCTACTCICFSFNDSSCVSNTTLPTPCLMSCSIFLPRLTTVPLTEITASYYVTSFYSKSHQHINQSNLLPSWTSLPLSSLSQSSICTYTFFIPTCWSLP